MKKIILLKQVNYIKKIGLFLFIFNLTFNIAYSVNVPYSGNNSITTMKCQSLYDHAGSSDYSNNADGYTVLNPSPAYARVQITGSYNTEVSYDYIYIYSGSGTGGTLLQTLNGSNGSYSYTGAIGQTLTVRFTSDGSVIRPGFVFDIAFIGYEIGAETGTHSTPTCSDNTFGFGAGAYQDFAVLANTYYYFNWSNGSTASGFRGRPTNGSGSTFTTNQNAWFSGTTTNVRFSSYRNNCTWSSSSSTLTYKKVTPTAGTTTVSNSIFCSGGSTVFTYSGGSNGSFDRFQYRWNNAGSWNNWSTSNPHTWSSTSAGNTLYVRARVKNSTCYAYSNVVTAQIVADPTAPTITKSPNVASVCAGATLTVTSSGGTGGTGTCNNQYRRHNGSSWSTWSTTIPSFAAIVGTNRIQSRRVCSGSGCNSNINEVSWTVVADPTAPIITKSPNVASVCAGATLTVTSSGGAGGVGCNNQYRYDNGSGFTTWSNSLPSFTAVVGTNTVESRRNCTGSGCGTVAGNTVSWIVQTAPTAPTSITGTSTICNGNSTTLTANGGSNGSGATYQWYAGGCGSGSVLGTSSTLNVSPISTTTYYVRRVGNTSCTNTTACTSVSVTVDQHTTANAGTDQYSCKNSDVLLSANTPTTGTGTWSWSGPGTVSYATGNANTPNATVSFSADGTYTGTWTLDNGVCASSNDNLQINTNAPDVITTTAASSGTCSSNGVNNWVHLYDATTNKIIASVNDQGQIMGDVTVTVPTVGNASASGVCSGGLNSYMGRYYSFSSTNSGWHGNNIKVRLYFTTAELNSLIAESHTTATAPASDPNGCEDDDDVNTIADIVATKYATGSGPGGAGGVFLSQDGNGTGFGASWVEFTVDGFSDIYLHGSEHAVPLPVELLTFTVNAINNKYIAIEWQTATEINNDGFELLRSTDGINFEKIAWIKGYGNTSNKQSYAYNDKNVTTGTYYYKLRQIDFDGEAEEFYIISATINKDHSNANVSIRPIPTSNTITIDFHSNTTNRTLISVYNYAGKKVVELNKELFEGSNNLIIKEVSDLPSGIYYLEMTVNNKTYTEKFVVLK